MLALLSLFGTSPFISLIRHMESVQACVQELTSLKIAFIKGDRTQIAKIAQRIADLERAAESIKNDIRNKLSGSLLLSMDKAYMLEIVQIQDSIADTIKDIAVLMTLKHLPFLTNLEPLFTNFIKKNIEVFEKVYAIVQQLPGLNEVSFSGIEAEKVKLMTHAASALEHEADILQIDLLRCLFHYDEQLTPSMFHLWQKIFEMIGMIANTSEKLALAIRMTIYTSTN